MEYYQVFETANRIVEGHRRGHYDIQETVNLLEIFSRQQPDAMQQGVFNIFWTLLASDPLNPPETRGSITPNVHAVAIRAISAFGPTAELPARVFARLSWDKKDLMELWASRMCSELSYALVHYADRFGQPALDGMKALCSTYTHPRAAQLYGVGFPESVVNEVKRLERVIEKIEFSRFAASLRDARQTEKERAHEWETLLRDSGLPGEIATAMRRAEAYLQGYDPLDPKQAADLIRTCMDETHRGVVAELETMTGHPCADANKDGVRRSYMREMKLIDEPEERFFSAIYTLLSEEGSHKLLAPKETVHLLHGTVRGYLLLLVRRLAQRRSSPPENAQQ
jgi:hypothetical protein